MIRKIDKNSVRQVRHYRMRRTLSGTVVRPRLNVYRSLSNIYVQIINDEIGSTLVSASTLDAELKPQLTGKTKIEAAKLVGQLAAKRALAKGIKQVSFDRGGYMYTGRVEAVASGAREAGLDF